MRQRFAAENPRIPGKLACRSFARLSTTPLPHFFSSSFSTIALPISQYSEISSLQTDLDALLRAESPYQICMPLVHSYRVINIEKINDLNISILYS
jgi:hypothetical protein